MNQKSDNKPSVYSYLESTGILKQGTEVEIGMAREKYWKQYKANWRRTKRKAEKEFAISLNEDELNVLSIASKAHHKSRTRLIKTAALAYLDRTFIVPNELEVRKIRQLLAMHYNLLTEQIEQDKISKETGSKILYQLEQLEREVLSTLHQPKTLEQWIKETINEKPGTKNTLQQLLNSI